MKIRHTAGPILALAFLATPGCKTRTYHAPSRPESSQASLASPSGSFVNFTFDASRIDASLSKAIETVRNGERTASEVLRDRVVQAALEASYDSSQIATTTVPRVMADTLIKDAHTEVTLKAGNLAEVRRRGWMPQPLHIAKDILTGLIEPYRLGETPRVRYKDCDVKFLDELVDGRGGIDLSHFLTDGEEMSSPAMAKVEWLYVIDDKTFRIRVARRLEAGIRWKPVHSQLTTCSPSLQRQFSALLVNTLGAGRIHFELPNADKVSSKIIRPNLIDNHSGHFKPSYSEKVSLWVATVFRLHGIELGGTSASSVRFHIFSKGSLDETARNFECSAEKDEGITSSSDSEMLRIITKDVVGAKASCESSKSL